MDKRRIIIAISGASGIIYGVRLLQVLTSIDTIETHLIISKAAEQTRDYELTISSKELKDLAHYNYNNFDIAAALASGSFKTEGMIVAPCSMKTLAEIATGITSHLISRAADVILKERRKLILMVRETPFHIGHLKNMLAVSEMGGIIAPPIPAFYHQPQTLDDVINQSVGRVLDLMNIETNLVKRWGESKQVHA